MTKAPPFLVSNHWYIFKDSKHLILWFKDHFTKTRSNFIVIILCLNSLCFRFQVQSPSLLSLEIKFQNPLCVYSLCQLTHRALFTFCRRVLTILDFLSVLTQCQLLTTQSQSEVNLKAPTLASIQNQLIWPQVFKNW